MLQTVAEYPFAGCTAYLRGTADQVRVLQNNADGTALVSLVDRRFPSERASGNRTVSQCDLYPTEEQATWCGKPPRLRRKAVR